MPDIDGLNVCRKIRDFVSCPILFLTARIEESDKLQGFASGGDDYVVKPFSLGELGARVDAHLRREQRKTQKPRCGLMMTLSLIIRSIPFAAAARRSAL